MALSQKCEDATSSQRIEWQSLIRKSKYLIHVLGRWNLEPRTGIIAQDIRAPANIDKDKVRCICIIVNIFV